MGERLAGPMGERQLPGRRPAVPLAHSESLKASLEGILCPDVVDLCPLGNMERVKSYLLPVSAVFVFVVAL